MVIRESWKKLRGGPQGPPGSNFLAKKLWVMSLTTVVWSWCYRHSLSLCFTDNGVAHKWVPKVIVSLNHYECCLFSQKAKYSILLIRAYYYIGVFIKTQRKREKSLEAITFNIFVAITTRCSYWWSTISLMLKSLVAITTECCFTFSNWNFSFYPMLVEATCIVGFFFVCMKYFTHYEYVIGSG